MADPAPDMLPTSNGGYITRAELAAHLRWVQTSFTGLSLRLDDALNQISSRLTAIETQLAGITAREEETEWLGPRGRTAAKWVGRTVTGVAIGAVGWSLFHFFG